jgi:hypothetical protein
LSRDVFFKTGGGGAALGSLMVRPYDRDAMRQEMLCLRRGSLLFFPLRAFIKQKDYVTKPTRWGTTLDKELAMVEATEKAVEMLKGYLTEKNLTSTVRISIAGVG